MPKAEYLAHLKSRLQDLELRLAADKKRLAEGAPREKVAAAGDLSLVEKHLADTKAKLAQVESEPESAWENLKAEMEEELDNLETSFDRWVERQA